MTTTTYVLIGLTTLVSLAGFAHPAVVAQLLLWGPAVQRRHEYHRFLGYGLVHADGWHLAFNMITLYFFGRAMEGFFVGQLGAWGFAAFYASALVVSVLPGYVKHKDDPQWATLGASGAVAAVLFAYVLLRPWDLIIVFVVPVPAIVFALAYVAYSYWKDRAGGDRTNHNAHLSGAAYGVMFTLLMNPSVLDHFLAQLAAPLR